jgi:hypothetical protein
MDLGFGNVFMYSGGPPNDLRFGSADGGNENEDGKPLPPACWNTKVCKDGWATKNFINASLPRSKVFLSFPNWTAISPSVRLRRRGHRPEVICWMLKRRGEGAAPPSVSSSRVEQRSRSISHSLRGSLSVAGRPSAKIQSVNGAIGWTLLRPVIHWKETFFTVMENWTRSEKSYS